MSYPVFDKPVFKLGDEVYLKVQVRRIEQSMLGDTITEPNYTVEMFDYNGDKKYVVLEEKFAQHQLMSKVDVIGYQTILAGEEDDE